MKTPQVLETDAAQIETEFSNSRAAGAEWLTSPRAEGPQGPVLNKSKRMLGIRSFSPIGGLQPHRSVEVPTRRSCSTQE
jgi:hypothetical protein